MALDPARPYGLVEFFEGVRSPVREDHDYFVASPPATLQLDPEQRRALEVRAPFFIDHGWSAGPDRNLVPFVWDPKSGGQHRFSEAESLTDYDSGLVGLSAVSAPTGKDQAQLFTVLTRAIVDVHRGNRDLLPEWFEAQGPASREIFVYFDEERGPAEEKLLGRDGQIDQVMWDARLDELLRCLENGAVQKHHFRWAEFLAHSVDIPGLVRLVQAASNRTS
jgi:hypothetical protein